MGIRYYKNQTAVDLSFRMQHKELDVKEEFRITGSELSWKDPAIRRYWTLFCFVLSSCHWKD